MSWFESKITYEKEENQGGKMKRVSEVYLLDAFSFTEAENILAEEMAPRGPFTVDSVKKVKYAELFLDKNGDRFYKLKVGFITLDEKAGVEKKKYVNMLCQASDIESAIECLHRGMKDSMVDYEIASVAETSIMDVIEHQKGTAPAK